MSKERTQQNNFPKSSWKNPKNWKAVASANWAAITKFDSFLELLFKSGLCLIQQIVGAEKLSDFKNKHWK